MKTTRIVLTIPEEHGQALRAEATRLGYNSPQNLLLDVLRGDVYIAEEVDTLAAMAMNWMRPINIPPAAPGRKKGKQ
jgi:hypothetical protein